MSKAKGVCYNPTPIGERFGRLVVIGDDGWYESPSGKSRARLVRCKCDCGKEITVRLPYLKNGKTTSCGCYKIDKFVEINKKYNQFDIQDDVCVGYCENGTRFIFDIQDYDTVKNLYWNVTSDGYIATHSIDKNKRIAELEAENQAIMTSKLDITELKSVINRILRKIAYDRYHGNFKATYAEFYSSVNYKLHINVNNRNGKGLSRFSDDEIFVHLCDYLASRKFIEISFEEN